MKKYERIVIDFCEKHLCEIFLVVITILAIVARKSMITFPSGDYIDCLKPWYEQLKAAGGFKGLASNFSNYSPLYLTVMALFTYLPLSFLTHIVKWIHIIFDFLLAFSIGLLTSYLSKDNKKTMFSLGYSLCLFIPSVLTNGAMWGQCDAMYAFFVVISLYYLIKEDYTKAFILYGLAYSFKQQALFIIPLYIVYYVIKKKFSILNFLIIPLIYLITCIPSILAGRSLLSCLGIFESQTTLFSNYLNLNFFNIWNLFNGRPDLLYTVGEVLAVIICGLTLFYCEFSKTKLNNEQILTLGIWFLILMTFVLPGMHDRYLFVAEALAVVYLLVYKKNYGIMCFVIFSPLLTYNKYLFGNEIEDIKLITILYLIFIIIFTINTFKLLANNND